MKHISTKTARKSTKWAILITLLDSGYNRMCMNERKQAVQAVATYFSYVCGYVNVVCSYNNFCKWIQLYIDMKKKGMLVEMFEENRGNHTLPYIT
jgi:hypothetical protein